jgi:SAM-dependent methyltransferase
MATEIALAPFALHSSGMTVEHEHHQQDEPGEITEFHFSREFWDDRYRTAEQLWSGEPNVQLVAQAAGLTPGAALEVGCGEGADAIWLAAQGWTVTGVDVSAVALDRAARHAAARGGEIAARITWRCENLLSWAPEPDQFDLVAASFMHLPGPALEALHRGMAVAVRPGGTFLVVLHHPDDLHAGVGRTGPPGMFPDAEALAARLNPGSWEVLAAGPVARMVTDLDGRPATVRDTVLRAVRRA